MYKRELPVDKKIYVLNCISSLEKIKEITVDSRVNYIRVMQLNNNILFNLHLLVDYCGNYRKRLKEELLKLFDYFMRIKDMLDFYLDPILAEEEKDYKMLKDDIDKLIDKFNKILNNEI